MVSFKRLSPLFIVIASGCATYQERVEYVGCHKEVYGDTVRGGKTIKSQLIAGGWDQNCHDDNVARQQQKEAHEMAIATQKQEAARQAIIEGVRADVFKGVATMEMNDPMLDRARREQLIDSMFAYVSVEASKYQDNGATSAQRVDQEVAQLFEIYDGSMSTVKVQNTLVRDAYHNRAIREIVDRYHGYINPDLQDEYQAVIDDFLGHRLIDIAILESGYKSDAQCRTNPSTGTLDCNF